MGLDVSHDAWTGAYSAFSRWREALAEAAGYEVAKVEQDDGALRRMVLIDWGHTVEENFYGKWDSLPVDPLLLLIIHADDQGEIDAKHVALLADRLDELLPLLPDVTSPSLGHIGNMRTKTQTFIDGCRRAAAANEPLDFH